MDNSKKINYIVDLIQCALTEYRFAYNMDSLQTLFYHLAHSDHQGFHLMYNSRVFWTQKGCTVSNHQSKVYLIWVMLVTIIEMVLSAV